MMALFSADCPLPTAHLNNTWLADGDALEGHLECVLVGRDGEGCGAIDQFFIDQVLELMVKSCMPSAAPIRIASGSLESLPSNTNF